MIVPGTSNIAPRGIAFTLHQSSRMLDLDVSERERTWAIRELTWAVRESYVSYESDLGTFIACEHHTGNHTKDYDFHHSYHRLRIGCELMMIPTWEHWCQAWANVSTRELCVSIRELYVSSVLAGQFRMWPDVRVTWAMRELVIKPLTNRMPRKFLTLDAWANVSEREREWEMVRWYQWNRIIYG